jgi:hypothetical protein
MSINRRIAVGLSAAALATSGLVTAGAGLGATSAAAATSLSHHCPSHKGKYPPGKCRIAFNHHHYRHHATIAYQSGSVFKPGERVKVTLLCAGPPRSVTHGKVRHARKSGSVFSTVVAPKKAHGHCRVRLHGEHSGITLAGKIIVKKKK